MATMANPQRIPQTSYLANRAAQPPLECPCVTLIKPGASRGSRSTPALRRLDSSNGMPTAVCCRPGIVPSLRRRLPPAVPGPAGSSQRGSLYTCWQAPSNILSPLLTGRRRKAADQTPRPQSDQHEVPSWFAPSGLRFVDGGAHEVRYGRQGRPAENPMPFLNYANGL